MIEFRMRISSKKVGKYRNAAVNIKTGKFIPI
jgi:hypothetical protein